MPEAQMKCRTNLYPNIVFGILLPNDKLFSWKTNKKPTFLTGVSLSLVGTARRDVLCVRLNLSYGGIDLKAYTIPNSHVCYSIFLQIALSLAVAERVLGFEHRDLHDENFLLEECAPDEKIRYKYDGAKIDVVSHGVRVSIIDYSISRLQKENVVVYADLSQDPGLFEQNGEEDGGDYQYDVYRMMKAAISDDGWASFCPQTNLYWLDYAAKKLFNNRFIRREKKEVIRGLFCPQYQNKFKTTRDFTVDPKFLTVFAKYISK
ncbi:hypothetical protein niasHT_033037 [Heterodera trifolii]|uniref:non-specific serine/threonine protein kinase n=1 Tax=Heterodera trifolii TaxID=157864 RepID=A0ABD2IZB7_9BILA